ncbi:MAG TPA: precorrin-8X methylmutase [Acidimicrobiales bacterium]|nr:precorrin-8X methylmutase [Acidimicrobiales bacterium]
MSVHPIEAQSMRILAERVDLSHLGPGARAVVERVIHASADLDYAQTMVVGEEAVAAGVGALRAGAAVVTDVEMVRHGLVGGAGHCYLAEADGNAEHTRTAKGMGIAAQRHPTGAVVVVGCSPTALTEVVKLAHAGQFTPALVIGLPVGFVGAAQSKVALRDSGLPAVTNVGEKGGSAVAAAAFNAIAKMAVAKMAADA